MPSEFLNRFRYKYHSIDYRVEKFFRGMKWGACQVCDRQLCTKEELITLEYLESELYMAVLGLAAVGVGAVFALTGFRSK